MRILYVCKKRCDIHMIRLQHDIVFALVIFNDFYYRAMLRCINL